MSGGDRTDGVTFPALQRLIDAARDLPEGFLDFSDDGRMFEPERLAFVEEVIAPAVVEVLQLAAAANAAILRAGGVGPPVAAG